MALQRLDQRWLLPYQPFQRRTYTAYTLQPWKPIKLDRCKNTRKFSAGSETFVRHYTSSNNRQQPTQPPYSTILQKTEPTEKSKTILTYNIKRQIRFLKQRNLDITYILRCKFINIVLTRFSYAIHTYRWAWRSLQFGIISTLNQVKIVSKLTLKEML